MDDHREPAADGVGGRGVEARDGPVPEVVGHPGVVDAVDQEVGGEDPGARVGGIPAAADRPDVGQALGLQVEEDALVGVVVQCQSHVLLPNGGGEGEWASPGPPGNRCHGWVTDRWRHPLPRKPLYGKLFYFL